MILYTPIAMMDIFPDSNDGFVNRRYMEHEGKLVVVDKNSEGTYQMVQLLSTDPKDFLNEKYTPGSILI